MQPFLVMYSANQRRFSLQCHVSKSVLRKMKCSLLKGFEGCGFPCLTDQPLQGCFKSSHRLFLVSLLSTCSYSLWIMSSSSSITLYARWKYPLVGHREVKCSTTVFAHKKSNHYLEFDRRETLQALWKSGFLKLKALFESCSDLKLNASIPHLGSSLQPLLSQPRSLTVKLLMHITLLFSCCTENSLESYRFCLSCTIL